MKREPSVIRGALTGTPEPEQNPASSGLTAKVLVDRLTTKPSNTETSARAAAA